MNQQRARVHDALTGWKTDYQGDCRGTRTLARIVPPAPRRRPRLPPEIRPVPALGPGRRRALGRPARPPRRPGLRPLALEGPPVAAVGVARARHPEPAARRTGRRPAAAARGRRLRPLPAAWDVAPLNVHE